MSRSVRAASKTKFEPYCNLEGPKNRIGEFCKRYPAIAPTIEGWKREMMRDAELKAKYENPEDFIDFNLSQFLCLTKEFAVKKPDGTEEKVSYKSETDFRLSEEKQRSFRWIACAIEGKLREMGDGGSPELQVIVGVCCEKGIGVEVDGGKAARLYASAAAKEYAPAQNNLGLYCQKSNPDEALRLYQSAVAQGYAEAQYSLGCYHEGKGEDESAAELYRLAAAQNYAPAQNALGLFHHDGRGGVEKSVEAEMRLYRLAADQGCSDAQRNLGLRYEEGAGGIAQNMSEAQKCYELAADQGRDDHQCDLGKFYQKVGDRAHADKEKWYDMASELYQKSARQGYSEAKYMLGLCYQKGLGNVRRNEGAAIEYYKLAADQGHVKAQYSLGAYYENKIEYVLALQWYKKAAEKNYPPAQHSLGLCYQHGIVGVEENEVEALRLYRLAANQGCAEAQNSLGLCYQHGIVGVGKDEAEALRLYRLAANQGCAEAQYNLGVCYEKGIGVEIDGSEAKRLYELSAAQGCAEAQYNLGVCYEKGIGVAIDEGRAVGLYESAARQHYAPAQYEYGNCLKKSGDYWTAFTWYEKAEWQHYAPAQNDLGNYWRGRDPTEAVRFYELAAMQNYAPAQYNYGFCCQYGIGVETNVNHAIDWYTLAAEQGYAQAKCNLGYCYQHHGIDGKKDSSLALFYYSEAIAQGGATKAKSYVEPSLASSKLKISSSCTALTKDQILKIINNLAPEKVRIFKESSHLIGDLVEVGKGELGAADLFEIHQGLSAHLVGSGVDPMKSKSCQKIRDCIAEKIKSEIGIEEPDAKIEFLGLGEGGSALNFKITPEKSKAKNKGGGAAVPLLSDVGGADAETFEEKLQRMQRAEKLTYTSGSGIIAVTKAGLEKFSAAATPAADVRDAGASAVADRGRGGAGGGGGWSESKGMG
jgi:TPR repeat protein